MQLVAASKMRRAQEAGRGFAPHTMAAEELAVHLASHMQPTITRCSLGEKINKRLIIVVASDKGLLAHITPMFSKKHLSH